MAEPLAIIMKKLIITLIFLAFCRLGFSDFINHYFHVTIIDKNNKEHVGFIRSNYQDLQADFITKFSQNDSLFTVEIIANLNTDSIQLLVDFTPYSPYKDRNDWMYSFYYPKANVYKLSKSDIKLISYMKLFKTNPGTEIYSPINTSDSLWFSFKPQELFICNYDYMDYILYVHSDKVIPTDVKNKLIRLIKDKNFTDDVILNLRNEKMVLLGGFTE
jgi:hypothetical protein